MHAFNIKLVSLKTMNANVRRCWLVGLSILAVVAVAASLLFMTDYSHKTYRSIEFSARLAYQSEGREDPITRELLSVDPSTNVRSNTTLKVLHSKVPTKVSTLHKVRDNLQRGAIKSMLYSYTNSNVSVLVVNRSSIIPYDGKNRESTKISATNKDGTEARDNASKTKLVASILQSLSDDHLQSVPKELVALASDYNFSLPCPGVYKPTGEVMQSFWVKPLLQILSKFASKQVTLVIANRAYEDILLNWLISATITTVPPIKNILVVAMDEGLHYRLRQRGIPSIYAAAVSLFEHRHRFRRYFEIVMMTRLLFMRIVNRLGFDCAMYDIDAIILKNPKPLYDTYATDIVGSRGALPKLLLKKWFVTICIGVVLIRSNERTGMHMTIHTVWNKATGYILIVYGFLEFLV